MIHIVAREIVKEECIEAYQKKVAELVAASRQEEGCISYGSFQSLSDKRIHSFIEEWQDEEAIKKHQQTEHFQRLVPQLGEMLVEKTVVDLLKQII